MLLKPLAEEQTAAKLATEIFKELPLKFPALQLEQPGSGAAYGERGKGGTRQLLECDSAWGRAGQGAEPGAAGGSPQPPLFFPGGGKPHRALCF